MKAISFAIIVAIGLFASHAAEAQRARPHGFGGERFEANKKFGLGLELGEPTGITGKLFISPDNALDFGIGDLYHGYYINGAATGIHCCDDRQSSLPSHRCPVEAARDHVLHWRKKRPCM